MTFQWLGQAPQRAPVLPFQWLGQYQGQLGAVSCTDCGGVTCWWCWDSPDFRNCRQSCINETPNDPAAYDACTCSRCVNEDMCGTGGVGTRAPGTPWRTKVSPEICDYQRQINAVLTTHGYMPVDVDCKLGPLTCGAAAKASLDLLPEGDPAIPGIDSTCYEHQSEWIEPTLAGQVPAPTCVQQPSLCKATQSCDQTTGECFEDCRKAGSTPCGPGRNCDPTTGNCVTPPPVAAKKAGPGAGVFVLGLAALLGIGFALAGRG